MEKEEPKQDLPIVNGSYGCTIQTKKEETLEEAAERYWVKQPYNEDAFIEGAKWQQERMYSEEEVRIAYFQGEKDSYIKGGQTKEMENEFIKSLKNKLNKSE